MNTWGYIDKVSRHLWWWWVVFCTNGIFLLFTREWIKKRKRLRRRLYKSPRRYYWRILTTIKYCTVETSTASIWLHSSLFNNIVNQVSFLRPYPYISIYCVRTYAYECKYLHYTWTCTKQTIPWYVYNITNDLRTAIRASIIILRYYYDGSPRPSHQLVVPDNVDNRDVVNVCGMFKISKPSGE